MRGEGLGLGLLVKLSDGPRPPLVGELAMQIGEVKPENENEMHERYFLFLYFY